MTTIDKIALCGIRSYDPKGLVVIKFFKPLTIILGNNGCGKTTIIEALKYVCCGDVPPLSDRGKSFVHDPKHCGVNVVKAQVKVAFKTRDGKPVIVNSSMQLTQKRTKMEFKTIDGVIRMYDESTNEQIALSHKCADMKKVVPELMGVSRAILDNVIFCHQEEANWPLSEAKKLKEKFDEIFATSRWSKALININQFKKTLFSRSKDLKADLKLFENNKEIAHKLTNQLESTKIRMAEYNERNKTVLNKIQQLKAELIPLQEAEKKLGGFDAKKCVLENDIIHLRKQQKNAHDRMQCEYEETNEELESFLKNHDAQIRERQNEMELKTKEYETLKRELQNQKEEITQLHVNRGKVTQIVDDMKHKKQDLLQKMTQLNDKYNIDEMDADAIIAVLQQKEAQKKQEMEQHQANALQKDEKLEKEVSEYVTKQSTYEYKSRHLKKEQREYEVKRQRFNKELARIKRNKNECENMENEIKNLRFKLCEMNENDATTKWEEEMRKCQEIIEANADKMRRLNNERSELRGEAQQTAILRVKKKQYESATQTYNKSLASIKPKIVSVLKRMPEITQLQEEFHSKKNQVRQQFEAAQKMYNSMETEHRICQSKLSSIEHERKRLQQSLSSDMIQLSECSLSIDDDIDGLIDKARESASNKNADLALAKCGRTLYSKFNSLAQKKNQCPVCQRCFGSEKELKSFVKTNTSRIKNVEKSGAIVKSEKEANKAQRKLEKLQDAAPICQNAMKKRKELQQKEKEFKGETLKYKKVGEELEEMFATHIESKSLYDKASLLQSNVDEICRKFNALQIQESDYKKEKEKMNDLAQSKRTLNDVENEYDSVSKENNDKNRLQNKLRQEIGQFDKKKRNANQRLIELERKYSNYNQLKHQQERIEKEMKEIDANNKNIKIEINKIQKEIQPIIQRINDKQKERNKERSMAQQKERKLQEYLQRFSNDIHHLQSKITQFYKVEENVQKYSNIVNDVECKEKRYKELEKKFNTVCSTKHELEKWLDNVVIDKADLLNNLQFRKFSRLVAEKKKALQELKNEMNEICGEAENIDVKINEMQTKIAIQQSNVDQNKGGLSSEKRKALELMTQLRSEKYKEIDEKYRQQLIKYETTLIANKDLDKFEKALDKSLIEFHSLKMKEINSVLKELWQQTYRGKDIDFIEIVSEIGTTKKRKSYNYSVVMIEGDATLSMRGRCSAGQRVLASLLIRLALAETFCLNCGVLALDEPTTNLDSKNIEALAYALNQIITRRKRQENFQLILITHDENFVEKLGQREHTDGYYRVFKNEYQHSKAKLYKFDATK